jgi:hypothetical protein
MDEQKMNETKQEDQTVRSVNHLQAFIESSGEYRFPTQICTHSPLAATIHLDWNGRQKHEAIFQLN